MLTPFQYYKIIFIVVLYSTILFSQENYNSIWGEYSIRNNSLKLNNDEISIIIDKQIGFLQSKFGTIKKIPFEIIIISENKDRKFIKHWDWALGFFEKNKIIIKDPNISFISKQKFSKVLRHEINHLFLNRLNNNTRIPRWFNEGFAMHYADENNLTHNLTISKRIFNSKLFNIFNLNDKFNGNSKEMYSFAYAYSAILFKELINLYGEDTLDNLIQYLKSNNDFEKAFYLSTLTTIENFNEDIYYIIKSKNKWVNLIKFPNFILIIAPLLLLLGFFIKKRKNSHKIREWKLEEELLEQINKDNEDK